MEVWVRLWVLFSPWRQSGSSFGTSVHFSHHLHRISIVRWENNNMDNTNNTKHQWKQDQIFHSKIPHPFYRILPQSLSRLSCGGVSVHSFVYDNFLIGSKTCERSDQWGCLYKVRGTRSNVLIYCIVWLFVIWGDSEHHPSSWPFDPSFIVQVAEK